MEQPEGHFDNLQERFALTDQVVGIPPGHHRETGLGGGPLGRSGREEIRPLLKLRRDADEQPPGAQRASPVTGDGLGPVGQYRGGQPQSRQMREGVALARHGREGRFGEAGAGGGQQSVP